MQRFRPSGVWLFLLVLAALPASCKMAGSGPAAAPAPAAAGASSPAGSADFAPEAVDHLGMTVTVDVEIFAIGKDTIELKGGVAVHRSGPMGPGGKTMVGDLIGASLRGESAVFGEVVAVQSPIQHSPCEYVSEGPGLYRGHFDINGWFWLPRYHLMVYGARPVRVSGTAKAIPPVGEKAESPEGDIELQDLLKPGGVPIGVLKRARGEIRNLVGIEEYLKTPGTTVPALSK